MPSGVVIQRPANVRFGSLADILRCGERCPLYPQKRTLDGMIEVFAKLRSARSEPEFVLYDCFQVPELSLAISLSRLPT